ncbi:hypothetical protein AB0C52_24830 [Streptomyces sp. NPDC048717]|uniref:hypothetical protein n=1 Tax=Streptomyces sp. NPDC048717 TaxID=3154928 RepID=UPI0034327EDC
MGPATAGPKACLSPAVRWGELRQRGPLPARQPEAPPFGRLKALPAPASGLAFTADGQCAALLTDFAHWHLTTQLRQEAQADTTVLQEDWTPSADQTALRAARTQVLDEVADQISTYRTDGPAATSRLDADVLALAGARFTPADGGTRPRPADAEESR